MTQLLTIPLLLTALQAATTTAAEEDLFSTDYQVWVQDQPVVVYKARVLDPPFADKQWDYGGPYAFANFDLPGPVTVRVQSKRSLGDVMIRPRSANLRPMRKDEHTLVFRPEQPGKWIFEPDGRKGPLLLFANPPESRAPKPDEPNVAFFGPGVHKPEKIVLENNHSLYLAAGAVVKAEVLVHGTNILIHGRGILDGSDWPWRKGPVGNLIAIRNSRHVEVNGITLRGSSHWTIVPRNSRYVTIRNVKICNGRVQNDDGINPCNSQDVLITDCFIRSDDDCVALKGLDFRAPESNVERVTVEKSILWCDRARIFLLGHESRAAFMRDVALRDLDIVHFTMTPFLFEPGEEMRLEGVTVENVRMHGEGQRDFIRLRPVVNQYMRNKVPGHIRNILFKNVRITGRPGPYLVQMDGPDPDHGVSDVTFENVSVLGTNLTAAASSVQIGRNTARIRFVAEPDEGKNGGRQPTKHE